MVCVWDLAKGEFDFKSTDTKGKEIGIYRYTDKESIIKEYEDSLRRLSTIGLSSEELAESRYAQPDK